MKIDKDLLTSLVQPLLDEEDEFVVAVKVSPQGNLRVLIDSIKGLTIDRCVQISHAIENQLDREAEDFSLEVSSAGLSEPFVHPRQYLKHCGSPVTVLFQSGEQVLGTLRQSDEKGFIVGVNKTIPAHVDESGKRQKKQVVEEPHHFAYDEVKSTKYRF